MKGSSAKKVVVIGPECTGKSELSSFLADHFRTHWVPEFAREYLNQLYRPYQKSDLVEIARGQLALEDKIENSVNDLLICDTNLYVIQIWSTVKYQHCDEQILRWIQDRHYDLYLLTFIDIPWEEDPLREHPHYRQELYELYLQTLKNQPVPFIEIKGERVQRRQAAVNAVETLMKADSYRNLTGD